jgi:hypothetical protein
MRAETLVDQLLEHSRELNPTYTREQHLVWALGFCASITMEKNHMDNIIWARLTQRIEQLYRRRQ